MDHGAVAPAGCALGSVGNPFDWAWPPTTSGYLQPIFSCTPGGGGLMCVCTWVCNKNACCMYAGMCWVERGSMQVHR